MSAHGSTRLEGLEAAAENLEAYGVVPLGRGLEAAQMAVETFERVYYGSIHDLAGPQTIWPVLGKGSSVIVCLSCPAERQ